MIIQDSVTVLYVGPPDDCGFAALFAGRKGWTLETAGSISLDGEPVLSMAPRVLAVCYQPELEDEMMAVAGLLRRKTLASEPAMLVLFREDPGPDVRGALLGAGFHDAILLPCSFQEFQLRVQGLQERSDLSQQLVWKKKKISHAMAYLEKYRQELGRTRKDFAREKDLLYNSLKQINAMTLERETLKQQIQSLETTVHDSVRAMESFLVQMIESRNERNRGHASRVAEISLFVAEKLGLEQARMEVIRKAALLHEVGMLFIPGSILEKEPGQLSDYEKSLIDNQPSRGAALLGTCPGFDSLAGIIRSLNENADGTGCPDGLKRRYIPLASRIIRGADMLDEFWSMNPEVTVEATLLMLEAHAGSSLDPRVVNSLEKYVATRLSNGLDRIREVGVHQLEPGMTMGAGLFTVTGTKLFSAGTLLTEDALKKLIRYSREYPIEETVFIKVN